jgi:type IV pilus assembly protein PilM
VIKNVFIPEKIGNNLLFGKKIVGVDIQKTHIFASIVWSKGTVQKVEQYVQIPIENGDELSTVDAKAAALISLKKIVGNAVFHSSLSSAFVMYKELVFPFVDREKIQLVIKYEIEPLLPFSVDDAVIDFIITKREKNSNQATILAACVQKHHLVEHLAIFAAANIAPELVTVDLFGIYGLYRNSYADMLDKTTILLDLGMHTTKLAYLQEGALTMIRVFNQGIWQVVKAAAEKTTLSTHDIFDSLMRAGFRGVEPNEIVELVKDPFGTLIEKIKFTLSSYMSKDLSQSPNCIVMYGAGAMIKGVDTYLEQLLHISVKSFVLQTTKEIELGVVTVPLDGLYSLGAAIEMPCNTEFNLLREDFVKKDLRLLVTQVVTAGSLIIILFGMLIGLHITQTSKLKKELSSSTKEVIDVLKEQFPKIPKDENNLDELIDIANQAIANEKELWFAFSYANQSRFLHYLLELTQKIDKETLGFEPEKITITEGVLTLKAQVKDYDALKILERELKSSPFFSNVVPQDSPNFTMQIRLSSTNQEAL